MPIGLAERRDQEKSTWVEAIREDFLKVAGLVVLKRQTIFGWLNVSEKTSERVDNIIRGRNYRRCL